MAVAFLFTTGGAHVGQCVEVAHDDVDQLLGWQALREQLLFERGDVAEQALGNRCQIVEFALLEQAEFEAMEADEGWILLAFFEVIGAGVDAVVQFCQTLRSRGQMLIRRACWQVQRLSLTQIAAFNGLIECGHGFDQRAALAGQIHTEFRQRPDESDHRWFGLGRRVRGCRRRHMQGAAWVAEQSAGDRVIAGLQIGVDHLAQARRDVFALFDNQHTVEDFPFHRAVGAVDDAETGAAGRHGQRIRLATARVNVHHHFVVIVLTFGRGHFRGVPEQATGGDHDEHRTGHRPAQGTGRGGLRSIRL